MARPEHRGRSSHDHIARIEAAVPPHVVAGSSNDSQFVHDIATCRLLGISEGTDRHE